MSMNEYLLKRIKRLRSRIAIIEGITAAHEQTLPAVVDAINSLTSSSGYQALALKEIGTLMATNQEALDAKVAELNTAISNISAEVSNVRAEVQSLKDQIADGSAPDELDFSGLESAIDSLEAVTTVDESAPVPAAEPPADETPATPVDETAPVEDVPAPPAADEPVTPEVTDFPVELPTDPELPLEPPVDTVDSDVVEGEPVTPQ